MTTTCRARHLDDPALAAAVLEIEAHIAEAGWDQPARLYALVDTAALVAQRAGAGRRDGPRRVRGARARCTPSSRTSCRPTSRSRRCCESIIWPDERRRLRRRRRAAGAAAGASTTRSPTTRPPPRSSPASTPTARRCGSSPARPAPGRRTVPCGCAPTTTTSRSSAGTDLVPGLLELLRARSTTWTDDADERDCFDERARPTSEPSGPDRRPPAASLARADHHRGRAGRRVPRCSPLRRRSGPTGCGSTRSATRRLQHAAAGPGSGCSSSSACVMALVVGANMYLAYRLPADVPARARRSRPAWTATATPSRRSAPGCWSASRSLMGLFAGASATGQWRSYLLWRNGGDFGTKDPYFDKRHRLLRLRPAVAGTTSSTSRWPSSSSRC